MTESPGKGALHPDLHDWLASAVAVLDLPLLFGRLRAVGSAVLRLAGDGRVGGLWLFAIPFVALAARWLWRRPLLFAVVLMIAIEAGAAAASAGAYVAAVQRVFARLRL